nr:MULTISPECIES: biotin/lipoyl-binding protein [unclassified Fusibacter]
MLLLTFFSKTFYHLSLPVVEVTSVYDDALSIEWFSTVEVESVNVERVLANVSASVKEVLVKKGDRVKAGDVLVIFDDASLREQLAGLELNKKAVSTQLALVNQEKANIEKSDQSEALAVAKTLYESGVIAKAEYQAKLTAATDKKLAANGLLSTVAQYSSELATIDREIDLVEDRLNACTLVASSNLQVQDVTIVEGDFVSIHQEVMSLQNTTEGFSVAIEMDSEYASRLSLGDKAQVKRATAFDTTECKLISKEPSPQRSDIEVLTFEITEGMFSIGEKLSFNMIKRIGSGTLIPKASLNPSATDKQTLYIISEEEGVFGKRNVVKEMTVTVTNTGTSNVLVEESIMAGTKIVSFSSRMLKAGDIVYVEDK